LIGVQALGMLCMDTNRFSIFSNASFPNSC
jgi:hypothetical protein